MLPIPDRPHVGLITYDAEDPDTAFPAIGIRQVLVGRAVPGAAEARAFLAGRGIDVAGEHHTKTRTALEFFTSGAGDAAADTTGDSADGPAETAVR
ncbi:MAG: hypothetical protein PV358_19480 [Acidimicrobiales bacterium]|nr:hypothetical protein [Acidimicrobiales bacterium]